MEFPKADPAYVLLYDAAFPEDPRAQKRKMFGCPCGFANDHMFSGVFAASIFVRLDEGRRAETGWPSFAPMGDRPMREYVVVPPDVAKDRKKLQKILAEGMKYALGLPPKKKPKKSTAPAAKPTPSRSVKKKR